MVIPGTRPVHVHGDSNPLDRTGMLRENIEKEMETWKRKYNRMVDRYDELKGIVNELRMRLEDAEEYIGHLKRHILRVEKKEYWHGEPTRKCDKIHRDMEERLQCPDCRST
jgi:DNA repair exonuclease SbcCD ATPase subunit